MMNKSDEQTVLFPDLDKEIAAFFEYQRKDGKEPILVDDIARDYEGLVIRTVRFIYGNWMEIFSQSRFTKKDGTHSYDEIMRRFFSLREAEDLIDLLKQRSPR